MLIGADSIVPLSLLFCPKAALWYLGFVPLLPEQLNLSSSSAKQWPFLHPIWCQDTNKRYRNGTALCTQSLCPESHQLLGQGKPLLRGPGIQPPWDEWHLWALHSISGGKKKKKTVFKNLLDHSFTMMSKENASGTPSHPSKFITFLQRAEDHLINCILCTADTG